uniref:Uncharacterized protein n=1 Tax=Chenopodium quinoa TaxID=63459 RepID=A0A803LAH2_CHEQI
MEHHHQPSILNSFDNNYKVCSITLEPIERLPYSSKIDSHEIGVSLFFHHKLEIHQHCNDPESIYQQDHNILWTEPTNKYYRAMFVITPQKSDMIEGYLANALINCKKDDLPAYVSHGVLSYVSAKVSKYLRENVTFDDDLPWFMYELMGMVDVSTIVDADQLL